MRHGKRQADLAQRLLQIRPDAVEESHVAELCESLIAQGDAGTAKPVVEAFLKQSAGQRHGLVLSRSSVGAGPAKLSAGPAPGAAGAGGSCALPILSAGA